MTPMISPPAPLGSLTSIQPALIKDASKTPTRLNGNSTTAAVKPSDQFSTLTFGSAASGKSKPKSVQFGSNSEKSFGEKAWNVVKKTASALGMGALGISSAVICWPAAILTGLLGLLIHPLLPVAALLGVAPFILGILGGIWGAKR